ncbi:MAG TPA: DUF1553 domain-containing protein [Fimbriiglobus sp.]|nr:DUF1553 domain-containing protein [Fimbriiglobus sp.]
MQTFCTTLLTAVACVAFADGRAAAADGIGLPGGATLTQVDFERHVMGLLSKAGCNAGSCHGSFQGKNGFRLSLFGYEPTFDHAALTRDNLGRRVDTQRPENSLLLLKATGAVAHDGGMRFGKGSWTYEVFREWIAGGAAHTPGSGEIAELRVTPPDFAVVKDGSSLQVKVTATFADGSAEDVTPFCDFKVSDDAVAAVSTTGFVEARKPGDVGLTVLYRGAVRAVRVLVPAPGQVTFPAAPANTIDREVLTKLKLLNMAPSGPSSDLEFLRRVTIDTLGVLPTPEEAREFLADDSPGKRTKKIDELLKHPLHAALWATKLSDVTGNNTDALEVPQQMRTRRSQMWHDWLRKRVAENQPYDQLARDILTATSRDGLDADEWLAFVNKTDARMAKGGFDTGYEDKQTLDLFWRRQQQVPVEQWGEKVAAAFLGVRLECAQCHKHPTDRWTQDDYWGFANLFAGVMQQNNQFSAPDVRKLATAENQERREKNEGRNNNQITLVREMYFGGPNNRPINLRPIMGTNRIVQPKALGGPTLPHNAGRDTRAKLWEWMHDPDNPFFARSFVNRVWAHYLGVGLVNPVDDFSQANPPTNPRLLDALATEFVASGYDVRKLERAILTSQTYQRTSRPNDSNQFDKNNFARSYVRPLMAEQVVDVLNAAVGVDEPFGNEAPAGTKMTEVGASRLNNGNLSYVLRIFGRPPRTTACDCERAMEPALPQTLFRMTDPALMQKLRAPANRATKLARAKTSDDKAVEELFLATLTRLPTAKEKDEALGFLKAGKNKTEALQDVLWALINTREFILNH